METGFFVVCSAGNVAGVLVDGLGGRMKALSTTLKGGVGGVAHSIALMKDGSVYCWGDNSFGQLGSHGSRGSYVDALRNSVARDTLDRATGADLQH